MKTVRFSALVETSGKPSVHLAWAPPAKDPALQKALKENRVVTVHQQARGSKKDYAVIGLEIAHDAQYLVFPRSLRAFRDRRIVGIQYDLLADSLSVGATPTGRSSSRMKSPPPRTKAADVIPFPAHDKTAEAVREINLAAPEPPTKAHVKKPPSLSAAARAIVRQTLRDLDAGFIRKAEESLKWLVDE